MTRDEAMPGDGITQTVTLTLQSRSRLAYHMGHAGGVRGKKATCDLPMKGVEALRSPIVTQPPRVGATP